jgi:hypothetical protein
LIPRKAKFMDAISVFVYGHLALVDLSMALWAVMTSGLTCTLHTLKAISSISILYFFASLLNRQKSGLDRWNFILIPTWLSM